MVEILLMFFDGDVQVQEPTCLLGTGHSRLERQRSSQWALGAHVGAELTGAQKAVNCSLSIAS